MIYLSAIPMVCIKWNSQNSRFELSNNGINTARVLDMAIFNKNLYCATEVGTFYTPDDGKSWFDVVETKNLYCHTIAKNDTMLFLGTGNGIFYSSIHSNIWQPLNNGLTSKVIWDIEANGNTLFAATEFRSFYFKKLREKLDAYHKRVSSYQPFLSIWFRSNTSSFNCYRKWNGACIEFLRTF